MSMHHLLSTEGAQQVRQCHKEAHFGNVPPSEAESRKRRGEASTLRAGRLNTTIYTVGEDRRPSNRFAASFSAKVRPGEHLYALRKWRCGCRPCGSRGRC